MVGPCNARLSSSHASRVCIHVRPQNRGDEKMMSRKQSRNYYQCMKFADMYDRKTAKFLKKATTCMELRQLHIAEATRIREESE